MCRSFLEVATDGIFLGDGDDLDDRRGEYASPRRPCAEEEDHLEVEYNKIIQNCWKVSKTQILPGVEEYHQVAQAQTSCHIKSSRGSIIICGKEADKEVASALGADNSLSWCLC